MSKCKIEKGGINGDCGRDGREAWLKQSNDGLMKRENDRRMKEMCRE